MTGEEITATLAELMASCKRCEADFSEAASHVAKQDWKSILARYATQRGKLAGELGRAMARLGGSSETEGAASREPLHSAEHEGDDAWFIHQCRHDEDAAKEQFEEALREDLPLNIRMLVQRQYSEIKNAREQLARWEDQGGTTPGNKTTQSAAWRTISPTARKLSENR